MSKRPRFRWRRAPGEPPPRFSPYQVGLIVVLLVAYGIFYGLGEESPWRVPTWLRIGIAVVGVVAVVWIFRARKKPPDLGPR